MAVELDHSFTTSKPDDESFAAITDLERVVPAVQGGSVLEKTGARNDVELALYAVRQELLPV